MNSHIIDTQLSTPNCAQLLIHLQQLCVNFLSALVLAKEVHSFCGDGLAKGLDRDKRHHLKGVASLDEFLGLVD